MSTEHSGPEFNILSSEDPHAVNDFFEKHKSIINIEPIQKKVHSFIEFQLKKNRNVVLITCGRTVVPLEQNTVRFISNFSSGGRGARSAEEFLRKGYAVIFLHHHTSKMPFDEIHLSARKGLIIENNEIKCNKFFHC